MIRGLGYKRDPAKQPGEKPDRDARTKLRAAPVPRSADNRRLVEIIDQLGIGSCVENAVKQAVRMSHILQGARNPPFASRLFGYYLDRARTHETAEDSGTFIRLAFENQNKFGFCPESVWPYVDDGETFKRMPSPAAFRAAYDQCQPTEYLKIFDTGADRVLAVKRAIAAGHGVAFGTLVSDKFCAGDLGLGPVPPPVGESIAGGHAMTLVGYDGDVFDVANSWGEGWGDQGFWKMSADYLKWSETDDLWICQAAPLFSGGV